MKVIIGYDLGKEVSQVSAASDDDRSVNTLPVVMGSQKYCIPTCVAKRLNVAQWLYGEEALHISPSDGYEIDDLLSKAYSGEEITAGKETFEPVALLGLFIRNTIRKVTYGYDWNDVACIYITVDELDARMIEVLRKATDGWDLKNCEVRFISYSESFFYYTVNQSEELRKHNVLLLDYSGDTVTASVLSTNRHMRPAVTLIEDRKFPMPARDDGKMLEICRQVLDSEVVSSVYLSGDGFEGEWEKETIRYLCMKRRVFQGRNLYTKGACYAALDFISGLKLAETDIYLDRDKLRSNIGINLLSRGTEKYHSMIDAGVNWFDASGSLCVMLGKDKEVRVIITPISGSGERCVVIRADAIPDRPDRACRVRLDMSMKSGELLNCRITDLGFGEIFPATGIVVEEDIDISDEGGMPV